MVDLTDETLFPGLNFDAPLKTADFWVKYYLERPDGALLFQRLLKHPDAPKHQDLKDLFKAAPDHGVVHRLLYGDPPPKKLKSHEAVLRILMKHLLEVGFLPTTTDWTKRREEILSSLHEGLAGFFDISDDSLSELDERLPGRYWIYRPSVHNPTRYVKGFLQIDEPSDTTKPRKVRELYRVPAHADSTPDTRTEQRQFDDDHEGIEEYEGIMLLKAHHPFMLSTLTVPPHKQKGKIGGRLDVDRTVVRFTIIARAETTVTPDKGLMTSMTGLTSALHACGGFIASPICFERIPKGVESPEKQCRIVTADALPDSVHNRLKSIFTRNGLIRF